MPTTKTRLQGLYAITDPHLTPPSQLQDSVEQALQGGAGIIQYRDKSDDHQLRNQQAKDLLTLCNQYNALLIINDDISLCQATGAHGVHLGLEDENLETARKMLGNNAIIGATCHGSLLNAEKAIQQGADYVAFGRFYRSKTKPDAEPAALGSIASRLSSLSVPAVAIGGINLNNATALINAGFSMLAVVDDVFSQSDIKTQCQHYQKLWH